MAARTWTPDDVMRVVTGYQQAGALIAAAELELFDAIGPDTLDADAIAARLGTHAQATTVLLDALAAMDLLAKRDTTYAVPPDVARVLTRDGADTMLAITQHHGTCLRGWVQLARVVQTGGPADTVPSIRDADARRTSFIEGMHHLSRRLAPAVLARLGPLRLRHLLDIGGGSGAWTLAFLHAAPDATATLFDLPAVIPLAEKRIHDAGLADRVALVGGDFYTDDLPRGADVAWLGAIVHQNSRPQNRDLLAKAFRALVPGGHVVIRDVLMDPSHTRPLAGALFAIAMLVGYGGRTYTFGELRDDLQAAGFVDVTLIDPGRWMDGLIRATKPDGVQPRSDATTGEP